MILYDKDYNFLGISSETVSFLGYEDISEFLSLYSDFADLLVEKEGKIYKFKNLSWIDFILYSGAPNKSAIVKMKDGSEVDIRLTVKELILTKELGDIDRCYAVRIINNDFVKIASKVNSSMQFQVNKNLSLSNLLADPNVAAIPKEDSPSIAQPTQKEEISLNYSESVDAKNTQETPISFDFPDPDELRDSIDEPLLDENKPKEQIEDIKFDFNQEDLLADESSSKIELDFTNDDAVLKTQNEQDGDKIDLGFLKIDSHEDTPNMSVNDDKTDLSFLKINSNNETPNSINKDDATSEAFLKIDSSKESLDNFDANNKPNLDFLKKDSDNSFEKEDVIKQIKDDLREIDSENGADKDLNEFISSGPFVRKVFNSDLKKEESV